MFRTKGMRPLGRFVVATALALVVAAGPLAAAGQGAAKPKLDRFSGLGSGFALRVAVDLSGLPAAVKAPISSAYGTLRSALPAAAQENLPKAFPFVIDQRFIETLAEMGGAQKAQAVLGRGFKNFEDVAEATSVGQSKAVTTLERKLPSADLPVLDVSAGVLNASVKAGPNVAGRALLASVSADLKAISGLLPAELTGAFDDLTAAINSALTTANGTLDTALTSVGDTLASTTDPLVGSVLNEAGLGSVADDATALTTELQTLLNLPTLQNPLNTTLASIKGLDNTASAVKQADGKVVSEAHSKIASVNVLNMLQVGVIDIMSRSHAAGTPGSAGNESNCSLANVRVGGSNGVSLDGKSVYVNGKAVPVPVVDVASMKKQVDGVLKLVGLSVQLCDAAQSEAEKNGSAAAQRVSAFRVEFAPKAVAAIPALGIDAGDTLLKIIVDPTVETAVAAHVTTAVAAEEQLPRTGASTLATVLAGVAVAGAALIIRRRIAHR